MSIRKKIIFLTISVIMSLSVLFIGFFYQTLKNRIENDIATMKKVLLEERKQQLKDLTSNAYSVVSTASFYEDAVKAINEMKFGVKGKNSFFVFDTQGYVYSHPAMPDLVGSLQLKLKNSEGRFVFKEIIDKAQKEDTGFVEYLWPKSEEKESVKKLTYFKVFREWKWIIATGLYINDIDNALVAKKTELEKELKRKMLETCVAVFVVLLVMTAVSMFLAGEISKPLSEASEKMREIAEGECDLTSKLKVRTSDEVGNLCKSFNLFIDNQSKMIRGLYENAEFVNTSSSRLLDSSTRVSDNAADTKNKAQSVNTASGVMNDNMISCAAAMEQTSSNVKNITAATLDMKNTIIDITDVSEQTLSITKNAVQQSESISGTIVALGKAAREIDDVTQVITEISEKTNLLALNATIESARAGAAGRGFAVVAKEIKTLAQQTKDATVKINSRISGIKKSADSTAGEVKGIASVINDINAMVSKIAGSSEMQTEKSADIVENINQIAVTIEEINKNVSNSSIESANIKKEISMVNQASGYIASDSTEVKKDAQSLLSLSERLKKDLERFKI